MKWLDGDGTDNLTIGCTQNIKCVHGDTHTRQCQYHITVILGIHLACTVNSTLEG